MMQQNIIMFHKRRYHIIQFKIYNTYSLIPLKLFFIWFIIIINVYLPIFSVIYINLSLSALVLIKYYFGCKTILTSLGVIWEGEAPEVSLSNNIRLIWIFAEYTILYAIIIDMTIMC